jgi:FkbM family methyltransferase
MFYFYAPARLLLWVLLGRAQNCPRENAMKSADELTTQISQKDRILAASRLLETDPKGFKLYDTPDGKYWIPKGSEFVLPFNLAEQWRNIYGWNGHGVQAGDVVLDCGANVGVFTRAALKAGAKLVVAIEPAPENIECLRRNFAEEEKAGRVIIYPKGVWDKDDFLEMHIDPTNSAADSFVINKEGWAQVEKVPLTTIDKLVSELKIDRVTFIKMDIEGAEPNALTGAKETLKKDHPRMALSAYHQPDHPKRLPELVQQAWSGYKMDCGPCAEIRFGVRPDVLYFFP